MTPVLPQGLHSLIEQQNQLLGDIQARLGGRDQDREDREDREDRDQDRGMVIPRPSLYRASMRREEEVRGLRQFSQQMARLIV